MAERTSLFAYRTVLRVQQKELNAVFDMQEARYPYENTRFEEYLVEFSPFRKEILGTINKQIQSGSIVNMGDFAAASPVAFNTLVKAKIAHGVLSVGTSQIRSLPPEDLYMINAYHLNHIRGNFLNRSTWNEIDQWTQENGKFTVVVFSPKAGMPNIVLNQEFGNILLHRALNHLVPGGLLVAELPDNFKQLTWREKRNWRKQMNTEGYDVKFAKSGNPLWKGKIAMFKKLR